MSGTIGIIYTLITICIVVLVILIGIVLFVWWRNKNGASKKSVGKNKDADGNPIKATELRMQGIESMNKFLAFDKVVDNMIVRKKGEQYVMVIQCKGVNFDLLGEDEKIAVENGFKISNPTLCTNKKIKLNFKHRKV